MSTSYEHPYALARRFATLDHLTRGRVGWNVVTGYLERAAANLGLGAQLPHDERYAQADEYLEVCRQAVAGVVGGRRGRRATARPASTPTRRRCTTSPTTAATSTCPGRSCASRRRSARPVIFQAGASSRGLAFAGSHAEAVFVSGPSTAVVAGQVSRLRDAVSDAGRDPASVTVFSQLAPVVAASSAEAQERYASYVEAYSREGALALFAGWTGLDLTGIDPDEPLRYVESDAGRSALASFTTDDPSREWTVDEVARHLAVGGRGPVAVGSGGEVTDQMEAWIDETGADGFNLAYAVTPGTFAQVAGLVVPELRRRGRMPEKPEPGMLRERLALR